MAGNLKVLGVLAERYEQTRAGRTGQAARDLTVDYEELLRIAGCATGDDRVCAERDLTDAESKSPQSGTASPRGNSSQSALLCRK
jgi:hypothetical protein